LDVFDYLEHLEHIADSESKPPSPPLLRTQMSPGAIYPVSDHIGEPWECSIHGFFETNLQRNPYSLFGTGEEYNYIQCEIKNKGLKRDYDNMLWVSQVSKTGMASRSLLLACHMIWV
jgi:hypothetical protein